MNLTSVRELSVPVIGACGWEKDSATMRRHRALRRFDKELAKGNYKAAHSLLKQLQHMAGVLLGFGSAKLLTQFCVQSNIASSLVYQMRRQAEMCLLKGISGATCFIWNSEWIFLTNLRHTYWHTSIYSAVSSYYLCMLLLFKCTHEVGHFLVGYLVGVLPRSYEVPSVQDITQDKFAQGNVQFLGFEFLKEVDINTISSKWFTQRKLKTKVRMTC